MPITDKEIWGYCWKCEHDTPHKRLAVSYFPRVVEGFAKKPSGKVDHRIWIVMYDAYQFGECSKCDAPSLFVDAYWTKSNTKPEAKSEVDAIMAAVDATGKCEGYSTERSTYPAHNKTPFPRWTHDLEEEQMTLFWEVYTAISMRLNSLAMMGIRTIVDRYMTRAIGDVGGFDLKLKKLLSAGEINNAQFDQLGAVLQAGHAASHRGHRPKSEHLLVSLQIVEGLLAKERFGESIDALRASTPERVRN